MFTSRGRIERFRARRWPKLAACLHCIGSKGRKLLMRRVWTCLGLATLTAFAGCGGRVSHDTRLSPTQIAVAKDATREELIEKFNARIAADRGLKIQRADSGVSPGKSVRARGASRKHPHDRASAGHFEDDF